ncbi:putative Carboxylesterase [Nitrospira japonica]|uniref:Putative Carboxylesterase n=1 Tax=Nitrospira japonica TaxID=1325564 RepID=A0A1W1I2B8_9BACT|nr:dienelactone hydrolase family protein [Nitrospira japonica]SLM47160.1 putative Carboxylesterase [Nitrospira japonica]
MREERAGGLRIRLTGGTDGRGGGSGPAVILLHGFGAPGNDLVPIGDALAVPPGTRFIFPEGPLSLSFGYGDSRAWWLIDMARLEADRAAGRVRDLSTEVPRGLPQARAALEQLLVELPRVLPVDYKKTVIGGFSQGAMLTCDLAMRTAHPFAGLVQLSGTLLARQEWRPSVAKRSGFPVFQSHGTQDPILPYGMAERLRDALTQAGLAVAWHSFRGGHEIPEPVMRQLSAFLTNLLNRP